MLLLVSKAYLPTKASDCHSFAFVPAHPFTLPFPWITAVGSFASMQLWINDPVSSSFFYYFFWAFVNLVEADFF
jgi:hypothetical protein